MDTFIMTDLEEKLIEVLRDNGDWMTRTAIAHELERPGGISTPYDQRLLDGLAEQGLIEKRKQKRGTVAWRYEYRIK